MSQLSDQDVVIRIVTAFEKGGIEEAKKVAAELQQQLDGNSNAGKTLSGMMKIIEGDAGNAANVFKGLSSALKGGAGAVNGLASAVKGLGPILGMPLGPLNLLVTTVQLVVTGIQAWKNHAAEAAEASKKAAEEAEAAAKQAAEALEKDMAVAADAVSAKIKGIVDGLKAGVDQANKLADATAAIDDAQLGLELAQLDEQLVGEKNEDRRAEIEQQKKRLRASREGVKLLMEIANKQGEISLMDQQESRAKTVFEEAQQDLSKTEERLGKVESAAKSSYVSALKEVKQAEKNRDLAKAMLGFAGEYEDQLELARKKADTAAAYLGRISKLVDRELGTKQSEVSSARQAWEDLVAEHAPRREILQKEIDAGQIKVQTSDVNYRTLEKQYAFDARDRAKAENDRIDKNTIDAASAFAEARRKAAAKRDKEMSVDDRIARAQGLVRQEQQVGEKLYGGEPGIETQRRAQSAIADAGRQIAAGQDDAQVITQLIDTLRNLGAVIPDLGRLVTELDKMDGEIDQIRSQLAHLR